MASILFYDIIFFALFTIWVICFLYIKRHNLKREGIVFLYRTKWGIRTINWFGDNFKKSLHVVKYLSIITGFVLMAGMFYLLGQSLYIYITFPEITQIVKAPPIMPLIPYFTEIFNVQSLLPPFYFTYFLIALVIVAVVHEFSHGIYMRLFGIKIKSTGFAFLGPILGAFVEEDREGFSKKGNLEQMSVLSAGVFANIIFALIFFGVLVGFFYAAYEPAGYMFNTYTYSVVPVSVITGFGSFSDTLTRVNVGNMTYFADSELKKQFENQTDYVVLYDDTPAVKSGLIGVIVSMDGYKIKNEDDMKYFLSHKSPGDNVKIKTIVNGSMKEFEITLAEHPLNHLKSYIGIANLQPESRGITGKFISLFSNFKVSSTYYETKIDKNFTEFVYNLIWWVMIINFFVALFNMLPLGILDGGRFFYLGILSVTKSKRIAEKSFWLISQIILLIFILLMFFWLIAL